MGTRKQCSYDAVPVHRRADAHVLVRELVVDLDEERVSLDRVDRLAGGDAVDGDGCAREAVGGDVVVGDVEGVAAVAGEGGASEEDEGGDDSTHLEGGGPAAVLKWWWCRGKKCKPIPGLYGYSHRMFGAGRRDQFLWLTLATRRSGHLSNTYCLSYSLP